MTTRANFSSETKWERTVGYSRVVRVDRQIFVAGTTATLPEGGHLEEGDAEAQTGQAIRNIERALAQAGARLADVVRTRLYVVDIRRDSDAIGRAHAQFFGAIRPVTTMVEVSRLIDSWMLVEVEADAVVAD